MLTLPHHSRNTLNDPQIAGVLSHLHEDAKKDRYVFVRAMPAILLGRLRGRSVFESAEPYLSKAYLPVSESLGRMMYQVARTARARNIVEFGSSYGISSIYLATAARLVGGKFTGSEKEPEKCQIALQNLSDAGLSSCSDIREGDAMESFASLEGPIDFVFLDGWKAIYVPMLKLLEPKLAPGAIIMADNIKTFPKTLKPFVDYVTEPENGYETTLLPFESGVTLSTWNGGLDERGV